MTSQNPNKNINYFFLFLFFIIFATAIYFLTRTKEISVITSTPDKSHEIPARPENFDQGALQFIKSVKKARVAIVKSDNSNGLFYTEEAFIVWRDVVNEYINNPPKEFAQDLDWAKNISSIYESIQASYDYMKNNQIDLATDKLDESRSSLNNVFTKNNSDSVDRQLFSLLLLVKKISISKNLTDAKPNLAILKFDYTNIKNLADKEETKQLFLDFETILSELDNATAATFSRSKAQLMPVFIKIYELY